jgi:hypothetical protein
MRIGGEGKGRKGRKGREGKERKWKSGTETPHDELVAHRTRTTP